MNWKLLLCADNYNTPQQVSNLVSEAIMQLTNSPHSTDVFPIRQSVLLYGNGTGDIVLDDLDCNSTESTLLDCQEDKNNRDNHDCTHSEDAGVRCGGNGCCAHVTCSS